MALAVRKKNHKTWTKSYWNSWVLLRDKLGEKIIDDSYVTITFKHEMDVIHVSHSVHNHIPNYTIVYTRMQPIFSNFFSYLNL